MDLQTFIIRRLVPLPLVLLGVAMLVFTISYLMPGDPVALALGPRATPEDRAKYRAQLGLDQPAPLQFARYLGGLLQGDFGISLVTQRPVAYDLRLAIPASLELSLFAITISVAVGIPLGVVAAVNANRPPDYLSRVITLSGVSMERAWTAVLLQFLVASVFVGFPLLGRLSVPPPPQLTGLASWWTASSPVTSSPLPMPCVT